GVGGGAGSDEDGGEGGADHGVAGDVALDRATSGLGGEVVAERLDLDGVAGAARELDGGGGSGGDGLAGDRDAVGGEEDLGLVDAEAALLAAQLGELAREAIAIDGELGGGREGRGAEADGDALGGAAEDGDGAEGGARAVEDDGGAGELGARGDGDGEDWVPGGVGCVWCAERRVEED